ncbi:uncharacterized protein ACA1_366240 [Acanthamoeba castellanii str. Neff]|uniref:Uncharacterized protein n=1 Tax=Acanthamoeba castellanii (strain ATCC 30010 / Neff) TaxID=1257118 RepID=L8GLX7_ACACF|nr:uncharacterized protein ACA1_366240 [Acanthamoeba castellanii str. Neff]ELR14012.1 hypothetical protein ACA1_366240 [Acanthamoeba castellanii str. Neff]
MAHLRSEEDGLVEEVAGGGESSLGRAVLAVLERLEKRVGLLEERVAEVALATTTESSSTGPSTSLGTMLEDVLVKLYQIEGRVDSIEKRQETTREEKEQRRSDKRRAATALLRQQGYAIPHHHQQRPTMDLASPAGQEAALASDGDHQRHLNEQADDDDGCEEQDLYDESGCSGEDYYAVGDERATTVEAEHQEPAPAAAVADSNLFVGGGVRKPLPAFPTGAGGRRAMTAYLPLSQSSELLLQLAEMELHERQTMA